MKINSEFISAVSTGVKEHVPEILTGIGLVGFFTALGLTVKATKRSEKKIFREERAKGEPLTRKEEAELCWKEYIPAGVVTVTSTATIIAATVMYRKKIAGIAAICTLAESALLDYKDEAVKLLTEDQQEELEKKTEERNAKREEILEELDDDILQNPTKLRNYFKVRTYWDAYCGRTIVTSGALIDAAINECNRRYNAGDEVTLNDYYDELDAEHPSFGNKRVWSQFHDTEMIERRPFGAYYADDGSVYPTLQFATQPTDI